MAAPPTWGGFTANPDEAHPRNSLSGTACGRRSTRLRVRVTASTITLLGDELCDVDFLEVSAKNLPGLGVQELLQIKEPS